MYILLLLLQLEGIQVYNQLPEDYYSQALLLRHILQTHLFQDLQLHLH